MMMATLRVGNSLIHEAQKTRNVRKRGRVGNTASSATQEVPGPREEEDQQSAGEVLSVIKTKWMKVKGTNSRSTDGARRGAS